MNLREVFGENGGICAANMLYLIDIEMKTRMDAGKAEQAFSYRKGVST